MKRLFAVSFLLAQPAGWQPPAVRIQDEGTLKGYVSTLNCVGAGISCSVGASVATVTVSGGSGGGSPGGSSGNVQINSSGAFGAYTGTSCAYAVKSLDENGAASCTAAPVIPTATTPGGSASELQIRESGTTFAAYTGTGACAAGSFMTALDAFGAKTCSTVPYAQVTGTPAIPADISSAHYVTTQAEAGLSAEAVLPTCVGTDKLTFNGTAISCSTDQTGGGGAPVGSTYITQTADPTLTNEQALSSLGTGLLKNTTGTGVLSIGASGTDYAPATSGSSLLKGNGAGGFSNAVSGTDYQAALTLPLSVANGGTGSAATPTSGGIGYGTGTAHAYSAAGAAGQSIFSTGAGAPGWADAQKLVRLTADYTNATTAMTNTALSWTSPAAVSRSAFICQLMVKSSVTTIGTQVDVTSSVAPTTITYDLFYVTGAGTAPATAGAHSVIVANANSTALGPTAGLTTYTVWRLEGIIVHTASASTVTVRAKASAAGTITIGSGSNCQFSSL